MRPTPSSPPRSSSKPLPTSCLRRCDGWLACGLALLPVHISPWPPRHPCPPSPRVPPPCSTCATPVLAGVHAGASTGGGGLLRDAGPLPRHVFAARHPGRRPRVRVTVPRRVGGRESERHEDPTLQAEGGAIWGARPALVYPPRCRCHRCGPGVPSHHISPYLTISHHLSPHLTTSHHISPHLTISHRISSSLTFADLPVSSMRARRGGSRH